MSRCPTLPSLPSAYLRLVEAMNDPYCAAGDFARIIEEDAGLTARVLKLVNSSMYGVPQKIDSVSRALAILGIEPLHDLVLATSAVSAFDNLPPDLVDMESFWKHSVGTAVISRFIGTKREGANAEALFVCGLLHDIGRLIIYLANPTGARATHLLAANRSDMLHDIEREEFGYDHAMVGSALLNEWGLPNTLTQPVKYHHAPEKAGAFGVQAATVHVADIIAHGMLFGSSGEQLVPRLSDAAWESVDGATWFNVGMLTNVEHQFQTTVHGVWSSQ
jgi:putative nucleotidyltransferase with HDIG domain